MIHLFASGGGTEPPDFTSSETSPSDTLTNQATLEDAGPALLAVIVVALILNRLKK